MIWHEKSALGLNTIKRAELADDETSLTQANDLAVRRALEAAGVDIHRCKWRRAWSPLAERSNRTTQLRSNEL